MNSIRSIDRAIDILQAFTIDKPILTIDEISKITKIPNSTVYRVLYTLERRGLVQFDEKLLTYKPGLRLLELGVLSSSVLDVRQEAEEILIDLHAKTDQTILMAVVEGDQIIYIYKREKLEGLKFSSLVGQRRPFIYGVLGPVLLAFFSEREIERILDTPIQQRTPYTVTDKDILRQRLMEIREDNYFVESHETNMGVTGIGAPVFGVNGKVIAAIGVIGPEVQLKEQIAKVKPMLLEAANQISLKMGYRKDKTTNFI